MRASERLRALDGALTPGPWPTYWADDDGEPIEFHRNLPHYWAYYLDALDEEGLTALRNALPLIADVVEAAEEAAVFEQHSGTALRDSLTALREHLEAGTKGET